MKRGRIIASGIIGVLATMGAWASDAESSATAGSGRTARNGTASATAHYAGDLGVARTDSRSGRQVSLARGVAVGVDRDGISLSVSHALATRAGLALAGTFNLSIGRDGTVSQGVGRVVAAGPAYRSASAGGAISTGARGRPATVVVSGHTDSAGRVHAVSESASTRATLRRAVRR